MWWSRDRLRLVRHAGRSVVPDVTATSTQTNTLSGWIMHARERASALVGVATKPRNASPSERRSPLTSHVITKYRSWTDRDTIRYGAIEEFNVDWKAECDRLNLAHVARSKKYIYKEETKTNECQCPQSYILAYYCVDLIPKFSTANYFAPSETNHIQLTEIFSDHKQQTRIWLCALLC